MVWNSRLKARKPLVAKTTLRKSYLRSLINQEKRSYWLKRADEAYSKYIRKKYNGECIKCGKIKKRMGVSHFFPRGINATRYEDKNCHWACWQCHTFVRDCLEKTKYPSGWYCNYMEKTLGKKGFEKLRSKSQVYTPLAKDDLKVLAIYYERL